MTQLSFLLLVVGLAVILLGAGCVGGDSLPTATVTPKNVPVLPTSTAVPSSDRSGPIPTPREEQRPPKKPVFCDEFDTWQQAEATFKTFGGPEQDPYGMDPDGDGIPCEALLEQKPR